MKGKIMSNNPRRGMMFRDRKYLNRSSDKASENSVEWSIWNTAVTRALCRLLLLFLWFRLVRLVLLLVVFGSQCVHFKMNYVVHDGFGYNCRNNCSLQIIQEVETPEGFYRCNLSYCTCSMCPCQPIHKPGIYFFISLCRVIGFLFCLYYLGFPGTTH